MNLYPQDNHDRLLELLADRALVGLDADEQHELDDLLRANPNFPADSLDRAAALLDVAVAADDERHLPEDLSDRILAKQGLTSRGEREGSRESLQAETIVKSAGLPLRRREVVAWLTATACLALAVFAWSQWPEATQPVGPTQNPPLVAKEDSPGTPVEPEANQSAAEPTIAQQREQLLASATDVLRIKLVNNEGGAVAREPGGEIVWSSERQIGYLYLHGLASNASTEHQYQLWIVGSDVSGNQIINGGMFHANSSTGELILPIQAEHFIQQPKMFVISVEPSGGGAALTAPLLARADGVGL